MSNENELLIKILKADDSQLNDLLQQSIQLGSVAGVLNLIDKGVNLSQQDELGNTALMNAIVVLSESKKKFTPESLKLSMNVGKIINTLIKPGLDKKGVKLDLRNHDGKSAFDIAIDQCDDRSSDLLSLAHSILVSELIDKDAKVDPKRLSEQRKKLDKIRSFMPSKIPEKEGALPKLNRGSSEGDGA